ncbi:MAG: ClbS/DfsB family four-helix bundle protein [Anaerolineales bacterium]|uniref:ClbS/DfsB family four-helix bundle protein n=1 Tax=Candidatus Villigracilis vicinus TaxID=3140679 RepID=UPI0031362BD6|nr:ClbS/DfsB family four-helix bundle protein [Anaerolineales bacterium]
MFDPRDKQLADLQTAYADFMNTLQELPADSFLAPLGDWTPRDIAAHFIGWNRITLAGCSALREGAEPFYFYDGTNDYRKVNEKFFMQFPSVSRDELMNAISSTYDVLVHYLRSISEGEWELDTGIVHYRGSPATIARCVDSLVRDYGKHRQEIVEGFLGK